MFAFIPTVGRTPYLRPLVMQLLEEGAYVMVLDASRDSIAALPDHVMSHARLRWTRDPGCPIYRSWNIGIDAARKDNHACALVLNDDVLLEAGAATEMETFIRESGLALIGFDDRPKAPLQPGNSAFYQLHQLIIKPGSFHGIGMFAFAVDPARIPRCDEAYEWYCGDDDLVYTALASGMGVGIAYGLNVVHDQGYSSQKCGFDLLREGWHQRDIDRVREKWGTIR